MENSAVLYSVEGGLARVTLNRPEKRNALNDELVAGLKGALRDADAREDVRAVLLAGAEVKRLGDFWFRARARLYPYPKI